MVPSEDPTEANRSLRRAYGNPTETLRKSYGNSGEIQWQNPTEILRKPTEILRKHSEASAGKFQKLRKLIEIFPAETLRKPTETLRKPTEILRKTYGRFSSTHFFGGNFFFQNR